VSVAVALLAYAALLAVVAPRVLGLGGRRGAGCAAEQFGMEWEPDYTIAVLLH
jgi:hypothetical protein